MRCPECDDVIQEAVIESGLAKSYDNHRNGFYLTVWCECGWCREAFVGAKYIAAGAVAEPPMFKGPEQKSSNEKVKLKSAK